MFFNGYMWNNSFVNSKHINNRTPISGLVLKILAMILNVFVIITLYSCDDCKKKVPVSPFEVESMIKKLSAVGFYIDPKIINKTDSNDQKNGLWLYENEVCIFLTTYRKGMKDGVEIVFRKRRNPISLDFLIIYRDSLMTDFIMLNNGMVEATTQNIRTNEDYPEFKKIFPFVGYDRSYEDGRIKYEGDILLGEEWEIDVEEIGEWKTYDEEGNYTFEMKWPQGYHL